MTQEPHHKIHSLSNFLPDIGKAAQLNCELIETLSTADKTLEKLRRALTPNPFHAEARAGCSGRATLADLDTGKLARYVRSTLGLTIPAEVECTQELLFNLQLCDELGRPNTACLHLFAVNADTSLLAYGLQCIEVQENGVPKMVWFNGCVDTILRDTSEYIEKNLLTGDFNSEISKDSGRMLPLEVFREVLCNALLHRDNLRTVPLMLLIDCECIRLVSPGGWPLGLNTEQVLHGCHFARNPILCSHAVKMGLPFSGRGGGLRKAKGDWPSMTIEAEDHTIKVTLPLRC
jgi:predicted HTH transcriptional regulator